MQECFKCYFLKPLAGGPGLPSLKCTSAAAPTQQQTVDCGVWGFKTQNTLLDKCMCKLHEVDRK